MKKLVFVLALMLMSGMAAGAEVLVTANPMGAGQWGYLVAGKFDSVSTANSNMYGAGGFISYGLNDRLDIYGKTGYGVLANPVSGLTASGMSLGIAGKCAIIGDLYAPYNLAVIFGYQATTTAFSHTTLGSSQSVLGDLGAGLLISKVAVPWVPYAAIVYHSLNQITGQPLIAAAGTGSNIEIAVGSQMLLSKDSALVGELSYNSQTLGSTSTDTQISIAFANKI